MEMTNFKKQFFFRISKKYFTQLSLFWCLQSALWRAIVHAAFLYKFEKKCQSHSWYMHDTFKSKFLHISNRKSTWIAKNLPMENKQISIVLWGNIFIGLIIFFKKPIILRNCYNSCHINWAMNEPVFFQTHTRTCSNFPSICNEKLSSKQISPFLEMILYAW